MNSYPADPAAVLHLVHALDPGGTQSALIELLRHFDPRRRRHVVVTLRSAAPWAARLPGHVACHAMNLDGADRFAAIRLARIARRYGASILHARNTGCWADALAASGLTPGLRLVLGFHGMDRPDAPAYPRRTLARLATRTGARFTSVSHAGRRLLHETAAVPFDRITVLRNGVDLERFDAPARERGAALRRQWRVRENECLLGTLGSLTPVKQHDMLIDAVAVAARFAPNLRLVLAGDGPLRPQLERKIRAAGLQHRIHLAAHHEDVPAILAALDAFVCCSAYEGVSNALLEALAAGRAVISTDVGDHADILRAHDAGLITDGNGPEPLAAEILRLAANPLQRQRLGRQARQCAEAFSIGRAAVEYEHFYDAVLSLCPRLRVDAPLSPHGPTLPPSGNGSPEAQRAMPAHTVRPRKGFALKAPKPPSEKRLAY